jgi:hypothetical protein
VAQEVLTALGERDGAVRDAERRGGGALLAMTDDEGFVRARGGRMVRQRRTLREATRLRRLADQVLGGTR